ncbi:MAG: carboxypeptidase-like regulatory domain-containing protein [Anaerolineae bacterium]|nr:carboxypeptidase-like regulatory domain-containing protein [Anaerolineae bacterium]
MFNFSWIKRVCLLLIVLAIVALGLLIVPLPNAHAQGGAQGKIEGTVVNVTKDAAPGSTANLTVTLMSLAQGATSIITRTTQTDSNGRFVFTNLDTISTTRYLATTRYADVEYYSNILAFTSDTTSLSTTISVYESTDNPNVVKILETHLIVDVRAPWLVVQQIIVLENTTDRVYVNRANVPHPPTLLLPILAKAIDVQFDDQTVDQTTLRGDGVLTYTLPIGPGKDQIFFEYAVPYTAPKYEFNLLLFNDVGRLAVYLVDVGATIQSQQLAPAPNPMEGTPGAPKLIAVAGEKLTAGTTVKATLDKLPAASGSGSPTTASALPFGDTQTITVVLIALAAGVLATLIAYPLLRRRHRIEETEDEDDEDEESDARTGLLKQIAALDDAFEAGEIGEAEYKAKRAALKTQVREMLGE